MLNGKQFLVLGGLLVMVLVTVGKGWALQDICRACHGNSLATIHHQGGYECAYCHTLVGEITSNCTASGCHSLYDLPDFCLEPGIEIDRIRVIPRNVSPGVNIRYKLKFTVSGDPNELYKIVVTGKAFSLYKPDGAHCEWRDKFDNPRRKGKKLYAGESRAIIWDRQIPSDATPGTEAMVTFTLKLNKYNEATETWNLLRTYYQIKKFNIVQ